MEDATLPPKANRLIREKSPYLLQHAHNPVDWYPWGEEAFERARREDKPIFLSIGYSTCHWCHVMAHESFEDEEVARLMNENFVSIKVDREERPDVDSVYMKACQLLTGSGGWPLTIVMTPEKKPFFAGTYFPRSGRLGRMGMLELIPRIAQLWKERREEIESSAARIIEGLSPKEGAGEEGEIGEEEIRAAYGELLNSFDEIYGGFGVSPKFPTPHNLFFLLRYWKRFGSRKALDMVEKTLRSMRRGGIFDQLGFGFHRYSTDRRWMVPHFEKMLYDQALLALAYLEAYQATRDEEYGHTAREIFEYVLRDLRADEGAFHSAEDADSEGGEGMFYLWTWEEAMNVLGPERGGEAAQALGITRGGNFPAGNGQNVLHLPASTPGKTSGSASLGAELSGGLERARRELLEARNSRPRPRKDDKILTDWNGLMIAALARGGAILEDERYLVAATEAAEFILEKMRSPDGRLLHRYREGEAAIQGKLDDYSFMIWGLIEVYQAGFDSKFLRAALDLKDILLEHFREGEGKGFFLTSDDDQEVLFRQKVTHDGALPSGNSIGIMDLLFLSRLTGLGEVEDLALKIAFASREAVAASPSSHTMLLSAVDLALGPDREVVIAGRKGAEKTRMMLRALRKVFDPKMVVLLLPGGGDEVLDLAPFLREYPSSPEDTLAYVCVDHVCKRPTEGVEELRRLLRS